MCCKRTDLRATAAQLTEDGLAKLRTASSTHVAGIRSLFGERYSASELEALRDLLGRLPAEDATDDACEA